MHFPSRAAAFLTAALLALPLTGCGEADYDGNVFVANHTDSGAAPEQALTFELASFGDPFSGNLLATPLDPGSSRFIGEFNDEYYDARSEMALGDLVEWFDSWVGAGQDAFFDIY